MPADGTRVAPPQSRSNLDRFSRRQLNTYKYYKNGSDKFSPMLRIGGHMAQAGCHSRQGGRSTSRRVLT